MKVLFWIVLLLPTTTTTVVVSFVVARPTTRFLLSFSFQVGDQVVPKWSNNNTNSTTGTIVESRGRGWYKVEWEEAQDDPPVSMLRASQLTRVTKDNNNSNDNNNNNNEPIHHLQDDGTVAAPRIYNLEDDADRCELRISDHQWECFDTVQQWVVFSDLHVSPRTLPTCLSVLQTVHATAVQQYNNPTGILFLGDFWHVRGSLRVDCLNAILELLRTSFNVPLIMIPGNHDQITYELSHNHSLQPLSNAYRIPYRNTTVPGVLILSYPTLFQGALFVPHIRDEQQLRNVLNQVDDNRNSIIKAIFCHADVTGACMNDNAVSRGGIPPRAFPKRLPVYSGHFHKPHTVTAKDLTIQYVGSPYQTSLAEAQQEKALIVLESFGWKCIEKRTLHIGRRHFRPRTLSDLLQIKAHAGDRVVMDVTKGHDSDCCLFQQQITHLRKQGAMVEIRPIQTVPEVPMAASSLPATELTVKSLWSEYLSQQVHRSAVSNETRNVLFEAGLHVLDELEVEHGPKNHAPAPATNLVLHSVTLQGFGPFREKVTYPLYNRGMVLLRGNNRDGGADSNGSGKTSLVMSILWALTGSVDPRPMQDAKTTDVINDEAQFARVTVTGTLNGAALSVTREKSKRKGNLLLLYDRRDLTTQSLTETQEVLFELLGGVDSQTIARTIFHGQHTLNELLESTDSKFKEQLSMVVPLAIWQSAVAHVRKTGRDISRRVSELDGMLSIRRDDQKHMSDRLFEAGETLSTKDTALKEAMEQFGPEITSLSPPVECPDKQFLDLDALEAPIAQLEQEMSVLEAERMSIVEARDEDLALYAQKVDRFASERHDCAAALERLERQLNEKVLAHEIAKERVTSLQTMWKIDISDGAIKSFSPPDICPTCGQSIYASISNDTEGHSHKALLAKIETDIKSSIASLKDAKRELQEATSTFDAGTRMLKESDTSIEDAKQSVLERQNHWVDILRGLENGLQSLRLRQREASSNFAEATKHLQARSRAQTSNAKIAPFQVSFDQALETFRRTEAEVKKIDALVAELESEREERLRTVEIMNSLSDAFGQRGVQTFVLQNTLSLLESTTVEYLERISDGAQRLEMTLDAADRIERRALLRDPKGLYKERPMASLSGGQWRRCSLALNLAFSDLVRRRGNFRSSLCVMDEPLTHLDQTGRSEVGNVLRSLLQRDSETEALSSSQSFSTIIIILQDLAADELEEGFDCIDDVIKEKGSSYVVFE